MDSGKCGEITRLLQAQEKPLPPVVYIESQLGYDCLRSTPINGSIAQAFVHEVGKYLAFESNLAHIKDPPRTYWAPPVDLLGELGKLGQQAAHGKYTNQYDFDQEFYRIIFSAHEPHLIIHPCTGVNINFVRPIFLVSASPDGVEFPHIYILDDVLVTGGANVSSSVVSINGVEASAFLETEAKRQPWDPDSAYNNVFWSPSRPPAGGLFSAQFTFPVINRYPGPSTVLKFANGSTFTVHTKAVVSTNQWSDTIGNGESFVDAFCSSNHSSDIADIVRESRKVPILHNAHHIRGIGQAPKYGDLHHAHVRPLISDRNGMIVGSFLDAEHYDKVAVLRIASFWPLGDLFGDAPSEDWRTDVREATRHFACMAKRANRSRLILDVTGNTGGDLSLTTAIVNDLFPNKATTWQYESLRAAPATRIVTTALMELNRNNSWREAVLEDEKEALETVLLNSIFNPKQYQTARGEEISRIDEIFTPHANMSEVIREQTRPGQLLGYLHTSGDCSSSPDALFDPDNVVLLTDGACSSACSIFVELLRHQVGIRAIAVGGLPQRTSMQANGGTKGANATPLTTLQKLSRTLVSHSLIPERLQAFAQEILPGLAALPLGGDRLLAQAQLNTQNYITTAHVKEGKDLPQHYYWEPAECRTFFTKDSVHDLRKLWEQAAELAWGNRPCAWGDMTKLDFAVDRTREGWDEWPRGRQLTSAPIVATFPFIATDWSMEFFVFSAFFLAACLLTWTLTVTRTSWAPGGGGRVPLEQLPRGKLRKNEHRNHVEIA